MKDGDSIPPLQKTVIFCLQEIEILPEPCSSVLWGQSYISAISFLKWPSSNDVSLIMIAILYN
jgi:hypothetical protein